MKKFFNKLRPLFILTLAVIMVFTAVFAVACKSKGKSSSDSSSSSAEETETITERTDGQVLKNGDFEFGTANTIPTSYPVSSSVNWTKAYDSGTSGTATTSAYSSGIIDTREYKYEYDDDGFVKIDEQGNPVLAKDENGKPIPVFSEMAKNNSFEKYTEEVESEGENTTQDKTDEYGTVQYFNPHTPSYYGLVDYDKDDDTANSQGGKVLMIHNYVSAYSGQGTAQYFTSSSEVTLKPGENGLLEAWVLTKDLKSAMATGKYGAYVALVSKVGSSVVSDICIKNINTYGIWAKIEIYIQGSAFATTTYQVKLGLGFGSKLVQAEYVEGFAFFDDVHFTVLEKSDVIPETIYSVNAYDADGQLVTVSPLNTDISIDYATEADYIENGEDGAEYADYDDTKEYTTITIKADFSKSEDAVNISDFAGPQKEITNVYPYDSNVFNVDAFVGITTFENYADHAFKNVDDKVLVFDYVNPSTYVYETGDIYVQHGEILKLSFWVKTNLVKGVNGLTIKLIDKGDGHILESNYAEVDVLSNLVTKKDSNKDYNDYVQVKLIITNDYENDDTTRLFSLQFTFGATEANSELDYFPVGQAFITAFQALLLKEGESEQVESTNLTSRLLQADLQNTTTSTSKDSYYFNYGYASTVAITKGIATGVQEYDGIVGNHVRVGGDQNAYAQEGTVAGIFNSKYIPSFEDEIFGEFEDDITAWLEDAAIGDNEYVQPLFIKNENSSYGYIATNTTSLSSNTSYLVTVGVKIFGDAKAYIYLSNGNDLESYSVLSVPEITNEYTEERITKGQYAYSVKLTADDVNAVAPTGYATVSFLIKTGAKSDINVKLELWNGSRDGQDKSTGIVLFDNVKVESSVDYSEKFADLKYTYTADNDYSFATAQDGKVEFTQCPTTIKDNDHKDGYVVSYEKGDAKHTATVYMSNKLFVISDLTTVDAELEIDNTTQEDSSSADNTAKEDETSYSPVLYITSIMVALALIAALIAIVVRHFIKAWRSKKSAKESYYDASAREKTLQKINEKKEREVKFKEEYDYDNMESNVIEDEEPNEQAEEVESAENSEEVVEENEETLEQVAQEVFEEAQAEQEVQPAESAEESEAPAENAEAPAENTEEKPQE